MPADVFFAHMSPSLVDSLTLLGHVLHQRDFCRRRWEKRVLCRRFWPQTWCCRSRTHERKEGNMFAVSFAGLEDAASCETILLKSDNN